MSAKWSRRADFVNIVLGIGVFCMDINVNDVVFDGVAGANFDQAVHPFNCPGEKKVNDLIGIALKLDVPVEGLEADGVFGGKWAKVLALCKEADNPSVSEEQVETQSQGAPDSSELRPDDPVL